MTSTRTQTETPTCSPTTTFSAGCWLAVRRFDCNCYSLTGNATSVVTVTIRIIPGESEAGCLAVEEQVPAGWQVAGEGDDISWDPETNKLKWGPFFSDFERVLSYSLIGGSTEQITCFDGEFSYGGASLPIVGESCLADCNCHPADQNCDGVLSQLETEAYIEAWLHGHHANTALVASAIMIQKRGGEYSWEGNQWLPSGAFSVGVASATRALPGVWIRGDTIEATIKVDCSETLPPAVIALHETIDSGLEPDRISNGGHWDPLFRMLKWGPFEDTQEMDLTYSLIANSDSSKEFGWSGVISVDGSSQPVAGDNRLANSTFMPTSTVIPTCSETPTPTGTQTPTPLATATYNPIGLDTNRNNRIDPWDLFRLMQSWNLRQGVD